MSIPVPQAVPRPSAVQGCRAETPARVNRDALAPLTGLNLTVLRAWLMWLTKGQYSVAAKNH